LVDTKKIMSTEYSLGPLSTRLCTLGYHVGRGLWARKCLIWFFL